MIAVLFAALLCLLLVKLSLPSQEQPSMSDLDLDLQALQTNGFGAELLITNYSRFLYLLEVSTPSEKALTNVFIGPAESGRVVFNSESMGLYPFVIVRCRPENGPESTLDGLLRSLVSKRRDAQPDRVFLRRAPLSQSTNSTIQQLQ